MSVLGKLVASGFRIGLRDPTLFSKCSSVSFFGKRTYATDITRLFNTMTETNTDSEHLLKGKDRVALYTAYNGEKATNVFPPQEFQARINRLRTYMEWNNIGACVFTSYHNICYFTGFLYCQFGRNYACVVTQDTISTVTAGIDGGQPWRRGYGDNVVYTDWTSDNFFIGVKQSIGDAKGTIGIEFDHVDLDTYQQFNSILNHKKFVDMGKPTMCMRMLKSANEIMVIKDGARVADIGAKAAVEDIEEGVPEHEVALQSTRAMVREIARMYPQSDILDTWTWFQSGINTDGAHNPTTTRKVKNGEILSLNCFPIIQGYYTAVERTLFLDHAPDEQLRIWEVNVDVHKRGIDLIQPGAKCCDIALELNEMYRAKDLLQYRSFGYGHSFGILSHYYGREAGLELREHVATVLEPNMVISMEPMLMIPEGQPGAGGYREHDILVVTENGSENITKFPFGPEHNIIKR